MLALGDGELERGACEQEIVRATRQFARSQRTWWRKLDVRWSPALPQSSAGDPPADWLGELARALEL